MTSPVGLIWKRWGILSTCRLPRASAFASVPTTPSPFLAPRVIRYCGSLGLRQEPSLRTRISSVRRVWSHVVVVIQAVPANPSEQHPAAAAGSNSSSSSSSQQQQPAYARRAPGLRVWSERISSSIPHSYGSRYGSRTVVATGVATGVARRFAASYGGPRSRARSLAVSLFVEHQVPSCPQPASLVSVSLVTPPKTFFPAPGSTTVHPSCLA